MIPRARANFDVADLARAATTIEPDRNRSRHRARTRALIAGYHNVADALLTPSGRSGLYAILKALPERTRVIVPAYTCNAVIEAATLASKMIVYADAEDDGGFNTKAAAYRDLVGPDSVVIATHQFGIPCEIEETVAIAHAKGALVVEDCAPSLGTRINGKLAGTFGDAAFFSFDCSKLIHVPMKGGAVIAKEEVLLDRIRNAYESEIEPMPAHVKARYLAMAVVLASIQSPTTYRAFHALQFGRTGTFTAESMNLDLSRGPFYRYDFAEWQAVIANRQLERLDEIVQRRRDLYATYLDRLAGSRSFVLPPSDVKKEWACIRFPIRVRPDRDKLSVYRDAVKRGVDFAFSFTFIQAPKEMTNAHAIANSVLDLPYYYRLHASELEATAATMRALDR